MGANASEITNFFWHCYVAARLSDEFPEKTVTKTHILHAVRKATDCWAGRNGVQYASDAAIAEKRKRGGHWDQCGLIKEHAFPVGIVRQLIHEELKATIATGNVEPLILSDDEMYGLSADVVGLFHQHPRAWLVAKIVRERTLHAWITKDENEKFDDKAMHGGISIRKCMPKGWKMGDDPFARYQACGFDVSKI